MESGDNKDLPKSALVQCEECDSFVFYAIPGFDLYECSKCGHTQHIPEQNNLKQNRDD